MEKKGELKNCKIFNKEGRILGRLQTEEIMPIIVVGKNESEDIIYREGLYFFKNKNLSNTIFR